MLGRHARPAFLALCLGHQAEFTEGEWVEAEYSGAVPNERIILFASRSASNWSSTVSAWLSRRLRTFRLSVTILRRLARAFASGEKLDQFLEEGVGCQRDRIAGHGAAKILVADLLGVRLVLADAVEDIGKQDRIADKRAESLEAVIDQLVEVDLEHAPDTFDRRHVDRDRPGTVQVRPALSMKLCIESSEGLLRDQHQGRTNRDRSGLPFVGIVR